MTTARSRSLRSQASEVRDSISNPEYSRSRTAESAKPGERFVLRPKAVLFIVPLPAAALARTAVCLASFEMKARPPVDGEVVDPSLWNLLHDATLVCAQGSVPGDVTIVVECRYLRHMFAGAGEGFVVRLRGCTLLEFEPQGQPIQSGVTVVADFEPEILSAESGDPLQVFCAGGVLRLQYESAETALDTGWVISIEELSHAAKAYWRHGERGAGVMKHETSQFESPDEDQRRCAIMDASLAADPASLPALLSLLPRDTYANRRHIARALGRIGGPDAESALLELLRREDGLLLGDVARALGQLKVVSAVEHLRALIEHDLDWVRSGAREALRRLGPCR